MQLRKEIGKAWRKLPDEIKAQYGKASNPLSKGSTGNQRREGSRDVQCHYSSEKVCFIVSKMTNEQRQSIKKSGFGSLLDMKEIMVRSKLIGYLVENFDDVNMKLRLNGTDYVINGAVFERVMRIGDGGQVIPLENANKYNPIRGVLLQEKSRLVVNDLVS